MGGMQNEWNLLRIIRSLMALVMKTLITGLIFGKKFFVFFLLYVTMSRKSGGGRNKVILSADLLGIRENCYL